MGTGFAILTELIQYHISYRAAEVYDLISDFAGIFAGVAIATLYTYIRKHK